MEARVSMLRNLALVGDIGATNTRLAMVRSDGTISAPRMYDSQADTDIANAIHSYLAQECRTAKPYVGVLAIAAAVSGNEVRMTNHPWHFLIEDLRIRLGLRELHIINDFAANALAISELGSRDMVQVGSGSGVIDAPIGVIGPGTGLGMSAFLHSEGGVVLLESEGGHVTMPAATSREAEVLDLMRHRYDHVSAERVLSGHGLVSLYEALCELENISSASFTPAQITDAHIWQEDPRAQEATGMFCAMLGTVAGNLALTLGARGGVYIAGGIVPKLGRTFLESEFRTRFQAKGRFLNYLKAIPTYVITRPEPALLGAAKYLRQL
jgi:glucokinase